MIAKYRDFLPKCWYFLGKKQLGWKFLSRWSQNIVIFAEMLRFFVEKSIFSRWSQNIVTFCGNVDSLRDLARKRFFWGKINFFKVISKHRDFCRNVDIFFDKKSIFSRRSQNVVVFAEMLILYEIQQKTIFFGKKNFLKVTSKCRDFWRNVEIFSRKNQFFHGNLKISLFFAEMLIIYEI